MILFYGNSNGLAINLTFLFEKTKNILSLGEKNVFLRVSYLYPKEVLQFFEILFTQTKHFLSKFVSHIYHLMQQTCRPHKPRVEYLMNKVWSP